MAQEAALELAGKAWRHLADRGIEQARLESELMLAAVLGINRLALYLQHDRPIDDRQLEQFRGYVRRRLKREPLQYILGRAAFRKLELQVDRRVLIPRPETEILAEHVIHWVGRQSAPTRVLDLGTGSGAIALSIAQETSATVVASDASADALAVAQANARRLHLSSRVEFRHAALFDSFGANERFDVIVSNPPYVADHERDSLAPEVREWEPEQALFAGADGLNLIRQLVSGAPGRLGPGGLLALEIGAQQGAAVRELLAESGCYTNIQTHKDLAGRERVVLAEKRER